MAVFNEQQRDIAIEKAKQESRRQDVKQHCTKIRDGIERLDKNSGERAVWELVQNAKDLSDNVSITILLDESMLIFEHEGKPFTFDSLSSLVKQVSSQSKEEDGSVGQYGTGFLTTHKFSRKIKVEGSFQPDPKDYPDVFFNIDNFIIDREFEDIQEFVEKMANQIKAVEHLLESGEPTSQSPSTKLMYPLSENSFSIAKRAIESAINLMPYVMVINENIQKCTLIDQVAKRHILFTKEHLADEAGLNVTRVNISENECIKPFDCYYLQSIDNKDIIILPLETATKTRNIDSVPKLFLFFPLLGTEKFGVNFIFHSERFYPEESRDGILLPRDNNNIKSKYQNNVNVLNEMSDMLFSYLNEHIINIDGAIDMASISFPINDDDECTQQFYRGFKYRWTEVFKTLPMINTSNGLLSISDKNDLQVFDNELVESISSNEMGASYIDALHTYGSAVAVLPVKEQCVRWSQIINEWALSLPDIYLNLENIAEKVGEENKEKLHDFLGFINICHQSALFSKYNLIPNREGRLHTSQYLKDGAAISDSLYRLSRPIVSSSMDKLVDPLYSDIIQLDIYNRKSLQSDISSMLTELRKDTLDNTKGIPVAFHIDFAKALRQYCCIFPNADTESNRKRIMEQVCLINAEAFSETIIPKNSEDDPDLYDTAFRTLLENELLNISTCNSEWVTSNYSILINLIRYVSQVKDADFQKRYFPKYAVFPNQKHELCLAASLKKNKGIDNDLAELYQKVFNKDIYQYWVDEEFSTFYEFPDYEAKEVAREIEERLEENDYASKLTIDIIDAIDNGRWIGLFKNIESKKEEIFFTRVPKHHKTNVYKLMKITDSNILDSLANLAENPLINEILNYAENQINECKRRESDFKFKHDVGKYIEDVIRECISIDVGSRINIKMKDNPNSDWVVDDIQNGQDIVISVDDRDIYYVEVKAKWSFSVEPAHMSKNQMNMAIRHPDEYALCCVDLTGQRENFKPAIHEIITNTYVHLHIADELQNIMSGIANADIQRDDGITMGGGLSL